MKSASESDLSELRISVDLNDSSNIDALASFLAVEGGAQLSDSLAAIEFIHLGLHTASGDALWSQGSMVGMSQEGIRNAIESGVITTHLLEDFELPSETGDPEFLDFVESFVPVKNDFLNGNSLVVHLQRDETESLAEGATSLRNSLLLAGLIIVGTMLSILGAFVAISDHRLARASRKLVGQERLLVELKTNEANELHRVDEAKNEFLSSLSHELKTPLAAMAGWVYILQKNKRGNLDEQDLERLGVIARNGKRLDSMINDLLNLSQIESENMLLSLDWFDISEMVADISVSFEVIIGEKRQNLVSKTTDSPIWLNGDRNRLAQVLTNLVSNASKYSEPGTSITVETVISEDLFEVSVHDQGPGVKPQDIESMGTLFYRTDEAIKSSTPGTGIGLYLSKKIAALHGGEISIQSQQGRGTSVKLTLPGVSFSSPEVLTSQATIAE